MERKALTKQQRRQISSSAFLMMTSAIGPAFLTQTALFSVQYLASFAFVILVSIIISLGAQLNIWRILTASNEYAQDISNKVLPGLGYIISFFIVLGGLAFNIGNVAGAGLGLNAIFGLSPTLSATIIGLIAIFIFLSKNGKALVDYLIQFLAIIMLLLCLYVAIVSQPPVGEVVYRTFVPENPGGLVMPIITIVGGTVGGYITFSGAHRLIETGNTGKENIRYATVSSITGIIATGIMRIFLFLAVLGVVFGGAAIDMSNPAASTFEAALGTTGSIIFGFILFAAGLSSVIGAAYTSASFVRTFHPAFDKHNNLVIVAFIAFSTLVYAFVGQPVTLLVLAGAFNGLILPLTLGVTLIAAHKKSVVGDYKHPKWLTVYGALAVLVTLVVGVMSLGDLTQLL